MIDKKYFENMPNLYTIMANSSNSCYPIIPIESKVKFDTNVKLMPIFSSYEEAKEYYDKIINTLPNIMDPKSVRIQKLSFINDKDNVFPLFEYNEEVEYNKEDEIEKEEIEDEKVSEETLSKKSSIIISKDKNGKEIYYQISDDGKKKRISKGIALEILEKEKNS